MGENIIDIDCAGISDDNFLEIAPEYLPKAVHGKGVLEGPWTSELRKQIRSTFDGPRHQLREEAHIGEELHDVPYRLEPAPVNVNGIAQGLESIETDADRKDQVKEEPLGTPAKEQVGK